MDPAPPPRSPLDRHRILSPSAAVRVSPLALGAMNFGDAWSVNTLLSPLALLQPPPRKMHRGHITPAKQKFPGVGTWVI